MVWPCKHPFQTRLIPICWQLSPDSPLHKVSIIYSVHSRSQQVPLVRRMSVNSAFEGLLLLLFQAPASARDIPTSSLLIPLISSCSKVDLNNFCLVHSLPSPRCNSLPDTCAYAIVLWGQAVNQVTEMSLLFHGMLMAISARTCTRSWLSQHFHLMFLCIGKCSEVSFRFQGGPPRATGRALQLHNCCPSFSYMAVLIWA